MPKVTTREVFRRIMMAQTGQTILKELRITPSKLKRILRSPRMTTILELQKEIAMATVAMHTAMTAPHAPQRLHEIAFGEHGEIGRRACLSLLSTMEHVAAAKTGKDK